MQPSFDGGDERARFGMVPQLWNQRRPLARMLLNPLFPVLIEKEFEPGFLGNGQGPRRHRFHQWSKLIGVGEGWSLDMWLDLRRSVHFSSNPNNDGDADPEDQQSD